MGSTGNAVMSPGFSAFWDDVLFSVCVFVARTVVTCRSVMVQRSDLYSYDKDRQ